MMVPKRLRRLVRYQGRDDPERKTCAPTVTTTRDAEPWDGVSRRVGCKRAGCLIKHLHTQEKENTMSKPPIKKPPSKPKPSKPPKPREGMSPGMRKILGMR